MYTDTSTIDGYDKVKFSESIDLTGDQFLIVLIALGKAAAPAYESARLSLDEVLRFT